MRSLLTALLASVIALPAAAQEWPTQTIRIVVGFTPGGSSDLVARLIAPLVSEDLGVPVIVENMPGAASTIAAAHVAEADPDGYTVFLSNVSASSIAPFTYSDLSYDPVEDFDDVSILGYIPAVLLASPSSGVESLEDFKKLADGDESVLFGTGGHGTMNHITGELLKLKGGLNMEHVAYKGSAEAMNDLLAGVIDFQIDALTQNVGQINAGAIKALAITTPERSPAAPDIPTFSELGMPDVVAFNWVGIAAPAGTPPEIIETFYEATHAAMETDEIKAQFAKWGMFHVDTTPAEAEAFVAKEVAKWDEVVSNSEAF